MTAARERLLGWLEAERPRQVAFLQSLTRVDSCNPPGDTTAACDLVSRFLADEGIPCRTEAPRADMPNLISPIAGRGEGRHLVLNGHLDVFPVGDRTAWSRDPLSGDIADGRVHGRGTVDMNCGTTALLFVHGCSPAGMGAPDESVGIEEFHHVLRTHALAAFDYLRA